MAICRQRGRSDLFRRETTFDYPTTGRRTSVRQNGAEHHGRAGRALVPEPDVVSEPFVCYVSEHWHRVWIHGLCYNGSVSREAEKGVDVPGAVVAGGNYHARAGSRREPCRRYVLSLPLYRGKPGPLVQPVEEEQFVCLIRRQPTPRGASTCYTAESFRWYSPSPAPQDRQGTKRCWGAGPVKLKRYCVSAARGE